MKKRKVMLIAGAVLCFALTLTVIFAGKSYPAGESREQRTGYLAELGWRVDEKSETSREIVIPLHFESVYEKYNEELKNGGYDLSVWCGESAVVYTYKVKNYPDDDNVNITLITVDGKIIAGDICSTRLDGFIKALCERKELTEGKL